MKIAVILTCFNRKEKTENCIRNIVNGNPSHDFSIVVVDDDSSDGTPELIGQMKQEYKIHLLQSGGDAYYSGGMRIGMRYVLEELKESFQYVLLVNDDVLFYDGAIEKIIEQSRGQNQAVIVGATCDDAGKLSYSAIKYTKGISYKKLAVTEWETNADTFNANCVLIPWDIFKRTGVIDEKYVHSLGDFDYGLDMKRKGAVLHVSKEYVGVCNNNPVKNTWTDTSLGMRERIRKKENVKGAPTKQWFYFLNKNFGLFTAIKGSITPYIRIIIGR